jgi:hypothetical protein
MGNKKEITAANRATTPYNEIAAYGEAFSNTCAINGVIMAPIRAKPLQVPKPIALIVVG